MPIYFLMVTAINVIIIFFLDVILNRRLHSGYLRHFVLSMAVFAVVLSIFWLFPQLNMMLAWERDTNIYMKIIRVIAGLLIFDTFVYFVHRYIEHGVLWKWHKFHHTLKNDRDLTYFSASMVGPEESLYYLAIQLGACIVLGMGFIESCIFITWVTQQGAYVHQKGLPQLPWPLISSSHHRTHHFKPSRYYGGLFLFWDRIRANHAIDPRAITGVSSEGK